MYLDETTPGSETSDEPAEHDAPTSPHARRPLFVFVCGPSGRLSLLAGDVPQLAYEKPAVGRVFHEVFESTPSLVALLSRAMAGEEVDRSPIIVAGTALEVWVYPFGESSGFAAVVADPTDNEVAREAVAVEARRRAALTEHASDVVVVLGRDGLVHYVNPALTRVLGYDWHEGDHVELLSLIHPEDGERARQAIEDMMSAPGRQGVLSVRVVHADGSFRFAEVICDNLLDDPAIDGVVVTMRDVTARELAERRLRASAERQARLADLGRRALAGTGYTALLEEVAALLGDELKAEIVQIYDGDDEESLRLAASRPPTAHDDAATETPTQQDSPVGYAFSREAVVVADDLAAEGRFEITEPWSLLGSGSLVAAPIPGEKRPVGIVAVGTMRPHLRAEDVALVESAANILAAARGRMRAEEAIRRQAVTDPLTGLPNRLQLAAHSAALRQRPESAIGPQTVFLIDLNRFKEINNTLGHSVGDLVLKETANRLGCLGDPAELVVRLGGDEFAVVCRGLGSSEEENAFARQLLKVVGEPLPASGLRLRLRGSVGIASSRPGASDRSGELVDLVRRAEIALFQAKADLAEVRHYADENERSRLSRLALASELADAIEKSELRLEFQPKLQVVPHAPAGVEALVRWQHPSRGVLSPDVFIPLAEQTGLIGDLTRWVLKRSLAECGSWQRDGYHLPVAVNLSAQTVHDPDLLSSVVGAVESSDVPPDLVELEITESAVMLDPEGSIERLRSLTERGIRLAIDDFGTGHSSLAYLQRLPVASLKIDKSFVRPLEADPVARTIVHTVVDLGHSLGLSVVAEGVDSAPALAEVESLGCDAVQGFYVARPMDGAALRQWIAERIEGGPGAASDRSGNGAA